MSVNGFSLTNDTFTSSFVQIAGSLIAGFVQILGSLITCFVWASDLVSQHTESIHISDESWANVIHAGTTLLSFWVVHPAQNVKDMRKSNRHNNTFVLGPSMSRYADSNGKNPTMVASYWNWNLSLHFINLWINLKTKLKPVNQFVFNK